MKKVAISVSVVVLVSLLSGGALAAGTVSFDPVALLTGLVYGDVELGVSDKMGVVVGAGFGTYTISGVDIAALAGEIRGTRYFGYGLKGGYATVGLAVAGVGDSNTRAWISAFECGLGYKWVWDSGFTLRLEGGFAKPLSVALSTGEAASLPYSSFSPSLGLSLGYSW